MAPRERFPLTFPVFAPGASLDILPCMNEGDSLVAINVLIAEH